MKLSDNAFMIRMMISVVLDMITKKLEMITYYFFSGLILPKIIKII